MVKGGVYHIDFYQGGQRIRRSLDTTELKEAKQRRDAIIAGRTAHTWGTADIDTPIAEFWEHFLRYSKRRRKATRSIESDALQWEHFLAFAKPKTLGSVTPQTVENFIDHLQDERGQKPRTVNNAIARLRAVYNFAKGKRKNKRYPSMRVYVSGDNPFDGVERLSV